MMYKRPMPCSSPVRNASSGLIRVRFAIAWEIAATEILCSQRMLSGFEMDCSDGASRSCFTAKDIAALCTGRCPKRVIAARRSVKCLPAGLNAAEFAACSNRAESRGSVPTILTISVRLTSGAASALRMRMTTSGKQGRLTVPFETSVAKLPINASAEARSSALVSAVFCSARLTGGVGVGAAALGGTGLGGTALGGTALGGAALGGAGLGEGAAGRAGATLVGMLTAAAAAFGAAADLAAAAGSFNLPEAADGTFDIAVSLLMNRARHPYAPSFGPWPPPVSS